LIKLELYHQLKKNQSRKKRTKLEQNWNKNWNRIPTKLGNGNKIGTKLERNWNFLIKKMVSKYRTKCIPGWRMRNQLLPGTHDGNGSS
jgi:hypothetical protein